VGVVAQVDKAFERKLKRVVRKRLDAGQDPSAVLTELKARLDPSQAEAIFADVHRPAATAKARRADSWLDRALFVAVMIWACALLMQNVAIIMSINEDLSTSQARGSLTKALAPFVFFATVKIGLLLVSAGVAVVARSNLRFLIFAVVLLYAFPLGVLIDGALMGLHRSSGAELLLQTSALLSYASVAALAVLWRRSRGEIEIPAESYF
jgi:hypothetical protein